MSTQPLFTEPINPLAEHKDHAHQEVKCGTCGLTYCVNCSKAPTWDKFCSPFCEEMAGA